MNAHIVPNGRVLPFNDIKNFYSRKHDELWSNRIDVGERGKGGMLTNP